MSKTKEFRLICTGDFTDANDAKNALREPFIEEYVEETGKFRRQDLDNIRVTNRISLGDLEIAEKSPGVFEITCPNGQVPLNRPKAEKLAKELRRKTFFEEIYIEPLD